MDKLVKKYMDALKNEEEAIKAVRAAYELAQECALPKNLRSATSKDMVEGGIIWYPEFRREDLDDPCGGWKIIAEVLHPQDQWKAYCADDGCRYGLDGAFVEE